MQNIHFKVEGQRIENTSDVVVVAKSKHEYKAVFSFSSEWEGLENKVAYFKTQKLKEPVFVELQDNGCEIPAEALETPYFTVSVAAGDLKTATICDVAVEETGYSDTAEPALSPKERRRYADSLILNGKQLQLTEAGSPIGDIVTIPDFDKFELWNDITLEEDVNRVGFSKKDDGSDIRIKELFLYFCGKFDSDTSIALWYDNGVRYQCWQSIKQNLTKDNAFWIYSKRICDGLYISIYPNEQITENITTAGQLQGLSTANKNLKCDISYLNTTSYKKSAKSWNFGGGSNSPNFKMLSGSRILIWGVQDDD